MKLLVFTDTHGSKKAITSLGSLVKKHNPDLLVCCGDLSIFEHNLKPVIRILSSFKKPTLIIHGNHENPSSIKKLCKPFKHLQFIHGTSFVMGEYLFLGYGGDGFSVVDPLFLHHAKNFEKILNKNSTKKVILITHAPPQKTKLDKISSGFCGNKSIRQFIDKHQPLYAFSGHIHENFGKQDKIKKTVVMNPGPFGKIVEL